MFLQRVEEAKFIVLKIAFVCLALFLIRALLIARIDRLEPTLIHDFYGNAGTSVALSNDGLSLLIGVPGYSYGGSVALYTRASRHAPWTYSRHQESDQDEHWGGRFGSFMYYEGQDELVMVGNNASTHLFAYDANTLAIYADIDTKDYSHMNIRGEYVGIKNQGQHIFVGDSRANEGKPALLILKKQPESTEWVAQIFVDENATLLTPDLYQRRNSKLVLSTHVTRSCVQVEAFFYRYLLRQPADSEQVNDVSSSSDGLTLAIGDPNYRDGRGAVWVYDLSHMELSLNKLFLWL